MGAIIGGAVGGVVALIIIGICISMMSQKTTEAAGEKELPAESAGVSLPLQAQGMPPTAVVQQAVPVQQAVGVAVPLPKFDPLTGVQNW